MFFAKPGKYEACKIFGVEHFILILLTTFGISTAVKYTKVNKKEDITGIIRKATIFVWILEIIKIIFNLAIGNGNNLNTYIPLYYCSILLYAGIFSSVCKGKLKREGDVFLATGAIIGGIVFIIFPTTSIVTYPMFHFISVQSFLYHGIMIYLGIIINKYHYIEVEKKDIIYYSSLIFVMCVIAYIINSIFGSNLMFISQDFPQSPITIIYHLTGKLYPVITSLAQMTLPFYVVLSIINFKNKHIEKTLEG